MLRIIFLSITFLACILPGSLVYADHPRVEPPEPDQEYQIKAAMLYKIIFFVRWKTGDFEDTKSPINLCLMDPEPFGVFIDHLVEGRLFGKNKRSLSIKRIGHFDEPDSLAGCHVFFIPKESDVDIPEQQRLLVVTENKPVSMSQAHINFVTNDEHVTFEINMDNLKKIQLNLSSKLLKLAQVVSN